MTKYAKLRPLTEPREQNLDQSFETLAHSLRGSGRAASVQCTILIGDAPHHWTLELDEVECRLQSGGTNKPGLEIITRDTTWWEIAEGKLSPLEAFIQGRLRIRGDTELGSHLLTMVASGGSASICKK